MNILVIDAYRVGLDFCLRCAAAGHAVRWFRWSKKPVKDGSGFKSITIIDDWKAAMPWARSGLIVTTGNAKFIGELERFRDFGFPIFGPTVKSAELEIKRSVGMEAMKAVGIEIPKYQEFKSLEDALKFAWKTDKSWVFKTMGDNEDKSLSYVSSDPADLVGWLQKKIGLGLKLKGPCMLQEKIDMLAELGVSGWFGPEGFLPGKWQVCFEHKPLMPGDIGPNCGEQGTVCQYVETDKLADEMLMPMVKTLQKRGHRGDFAIGCGIDTKGRAWPFEFTARLGWPAFYIQVASHIGDPAQWMKDLLSGKDTLKTSPDVAIGVVMAQPPYPFEEGDPKEVEGNPISHVDEHYDALHFAGVMIVKGPKMDKCKVVEGPTYQTTSEHVLIGTGLGATVEAARGKVYSVVDDIKFPGRMFRNDIGCKLEKPLPKLHKFGYCTQMEFLEKKE